MPDYKRFVGNVPRLRIRHRYAEELERILSRLEVLRPDLIFEWWAERERHVKRGIEDMLKVRVVDRKSPHEIHLRFGFGSNVAISELVVRNTLATAGVTFQDEGSKDEVPTQNNMRGSEATG